MKAITVGRFLKQTDVPYEAVTVREDASLREVLETMLGHREQRSAFVVDGNGALQGVISLGALARHFIHEGIAPQNGFSPSTDILHYLTAENAADIMNREVVFCTEDESLQSAAKKMLGHQVFKILPVLDAERHIVGVLTLLDLLESAP